ncbi:MAG: hypothetical protein KIT47_11215 [Rhodoferax sp.]|nr:hypothetical protein [Rhodoferax sp.]
MLTNLGCENPKTMGEGHRQRRLADADKVATAILSTEGLDTTPRQFAPAGDAGISAA